MNIQEKKELRNQLLKGLYDWNEQSAGRPKQITVSMPMTEDEKKNHLAYEYIRDKSYIDYSSKASTLFFAKITAYGIDKIEEELQ
ncbi:hypothetical protein CSV79_01635 [Sporosarcina sp. P13]|uniref:hypothetical protein n=1 Tax=Sporosarcina sp. P13 TaxID=2048263 RepID=UPI000C168F7F|nr:hypothetical protein [Sporosarcina sp. P13]PIC65349.1 hypothetical protein CSV79_01635 [Sporosarcina sp. P13]